MIEIFDNIKEEVRDMAEFSWKIALKQNTPQDAAEFLNNVTNYYMSFGTPEEVEFLRFYFNMKMEMMNK